MHELNPEDLDRLAEPNAIGGIVRVRSNSNIEIKINPTQDPITQFIDAVLQLSNHHTFDILPSESKGAALKYLSSVMGIAPTLDKSDGLQEIDLNKSYLMFANPQTTNLEDVEQLNERGFSVNVVRVR